MSRLFFRIFFWFWLATTCLFVVLILGFLIIQPDARAMWGVVGANMARSAGASAANAYEQQGEAAALSLFSTFTRSGGLRIWLCPRNGNPIGESPAPAVIENVVKRAFTAGQSESRIGDGMVLLAYRVQSNAGKPYVTVWEVPSRFSRHSIRGFFSLRLLSLFLTGGFVCLWLTWQITRPIRALRSATRQFSQGDFAVRIGAQGDFGRGDELTDLAHDFDLMAARIEEMIKSQQQLLADISHELRSPLTRLSLALDLARRRLGDEIPEHRRIEREVVRLNELIEQLLTLARLQGKARDKQSEMVNVRALLREIVEDARFEAEAKGKKVLLEDCDATVLGSSTLLRSAIENVVRNAVRHTPEHSEVTVTLQCPDDAGNMIISVRDHGPGVPPQALSRLFDPFFRVEEGRDRVSGGVGLGLAIVRQAMQFHGGNAVAENLPTGGLLVRLELPKK